MGSNTRYNEFAIFSHTFCLALIKLKTNSDFINDGQTVFILLPTRPRPTRMVFGGKFHLCCTCRYIFKTALTVEVGSTFCNRRLLPNSRRPARSDATKQTSHAGIALLLWGKGKKSGVSKMRRRSGAVAEDRAERAAATIMTSSVHQLAGAPRATHT